MSDLPGYITEEGTARYAARFPQLAPTHFRLRHGVQVSSIGIGTYLGENDAQSSANYIESIKLAIRNGCNLIDTAVNYRMMQSERDATSAARCTSWLEGANLSALNSWSAPRAATFPMMARCQPTRLRISKSALWRQNWQRQMKLWAICTAWHPIFSPAKSS